MGLVTMTKQRAIQIWRNRTGVLVDDETTDRLPLFHPKKGGCIVIDAYISLDMLEALVVLGREQVPRQASDRPLNVKLARGVLEDKSVGYITPFRVAEHEGDAPKVRATVEVSGETRLEELEALLLLWKNAK